MEKRRSRRKRGPTDEQIIQRLLQDLCVVVGWRESSTNAVQEKDSIGAGECNDEWACEILPSSVISKKCNDFKNQNFVHLLGRKRTKVVDGLRDMERKTVNWERVVWGRKKQNPSPPNPLLPGSGLLPSIRLPYDFAQHAPARSVSQAGYQSQVINLPRYKKTASEPDLRRALRFSTKERDQGLWKKRLSQTNDALQSRLKLDPVRKSQRSKKKEGTAKILEVDDQHLLRVVDNHAHLSPPNSPKQLAPQEKAIAQHRSFQPIAFGRSPRAHFDMRTAKNYAGHIQSNPRNRRKDITKKFGTLPEGATDDSKIYIASPSKRVKYGLK